MATIYQESTWNGVAVDTYTDTTTGTIQVYAKGFAPLGGLGGVLIAESKPKNGNSDWTLVDETRYRRTVNNQRDRDGELPYTEAQFKAQFFGDGTRHFNNNRAAVLNKPGTSSINERQGFFDNRVPFTSNPTGNQERVNSDGSITEQRVVNPNADPDPDAESSATVPLNGADGNGGGGSGAIGDSSGGSNTGTNPGDTSGGTNILNPDDPNSGSDGLDNSDGSTNDDNIITIENPNDTAFDDNTKTGGDEGGYISYPSIEPPAGLEYDYVTFTAYEYNPSGVSLSQRQYDITGGTKYETIELPIQPTISETNSVSWTGDTLNEIQKGFADLSAGAIEFMGGDGGYRIKKAVQEGTAALKKIVDNPTTSKAIVAFFAGQAVGANIMGRSTGAIINPNLELLFTGPSLRSFNFNFRLTPRNADESSSIRKMIRAFKRNSAVQRQNSNLFLMSPRVFQIEYNYKGQGQHPYLNKIKPCALQSFNVNYTPDGSYMVFGSTGSLTAYDITLSFTEINPIYADEYNGSSTDMGF